MNRRGVMNSLRTSGLIPAQDSAAPESSPRPVLRAEQAKTRHPVFWTLWFVVNILLILSFALAAYSAVWEYSTRRYLKGFSDAVVPASAPPEEKVVAILDWMSNGPARLDSDLGEFSDHRDPIETLNYASLLRVCGSATSAFVNLADSAGLQARRLLLLNSSDTTKHVVAEVLIQGRWIVVDPAYRVILQDPSGEYLTREELADPSVLAAATTGIRHYSPTYTFDHTAHIRLARLGIAGRSLGAVLNGIIPSWESSETMTLLVERESFATLFLSLALFVFLLSLRTLLSLYADRKLKIGSRLRVRQKLTQVVGVFLNTAEGD